MSKHDPKVTLAQIEEFVVEVGSYLENETLESLLADRIRCRAFERVMSCIGEAVKRLPMPLREAYPEVDWKGAAGLRDWVTHGYDGLDYPVLWKASHEQLPELLETVRRMRADLDQTTPGPSTN